MDHRAGQPSWLPEVAAPDGTGPESEEAAGPAQEQPGQAPSVFGKGDVTVPNKKRGSGEGSNGTGRGEDLTVPAEQPAADTGYGPGHDGMLAYPGESPYGAGQGGSSRATDQAPAGGGSPSVGSFPLGSSGYAPGDSEYSPEDVGQASGAGSVFTPDTSEAGSVFTPDTGSAYARDPGTASPRDAGDPYTRDPGDPYTRDPGDAYVQDAGGASASDSGDTYGRDPGRAHTGRPGDPYPRDAGGASAADFGSAYAHDADGAHAGGPVDPYTRDAGGAYTRDARGALAHDSGGASAPGARGAHVGGPGDPYTREAGVAYAQDTDEAPTYDAGAAYTRPVGGYTPDGARYTPDPAPPLPADPVAPTYRAGFAAEAAALGDPAANAGPGMGAATGAASAAMGRSTAGQGLSGSAGTLGDATASGATAPGARRVRVGFGVRRPSAYGAAARTRPAGTQARRANLVLARLEPWSVMKFSFLISLVSWLVLFVAVAILYYALSGLGVFEALQRTLSSVTSSQGSSGVNLSRWTSAPRVLGYTMLIGAANVVLITALSTVGAMIYNLVTHLGGGIEITLKETE